MKMFGIPTCKEVYKKRDQLEQSSLVEKFSYQLHMAICKNCRNFDETLKLIEAKMRKSLLINSSKSHIEKVNDIKLKVKEEIKKQSIK